tara:strand:- start:728 stop:2005 length:1278 start_codon:yes stop_codon:yes gene_type:complete
MKTFDTILKLKNEGRTWREIAEALNMQREAVRSIYRNRTKKKKFTDCEGNFSSRSKSWQDGFLTATKISDREIETPEDVSRFFGLDPVEWEVSSFSCNFWQQKPGGEGDLYQIKGKFAPKKAVADARDEIRELIDAAKKKSPKKKLLKRGKVSKRSTRMGLVSIADLHIDKLAIGDVTLGPDQNFELQRDVAEEAIEGLANKISRDNLDEIWFPVGHDLFNDDSRIKKIPTTSNGTPQQSELDWQKVYRETRVFLCRMIDDVLSQVAPVFVPIIPGNHDESKTFMLGDAIEVWSENNKNVTVDNSQGLRRYYEFGNCLFGMTHTIKFTQANAIMSQEAAGLWRPSQHREWLVGHLHQSRTTALNVRPMDLDRQVDGLMIRTLPSLSSADEWHSQNGFIGAVSAGLGLCYDAETGLDASYPWISKV